MISIARGVTIAV
uniref:Uncharacterized protein n=1 Tax=Arundo donax TaxID=35708 RepID=A0A0A9GY86_ARUDO